MDINKQSTINSKSVIQNRFFRFIVQSYLFLIKTTIASSNQLLRRPTKDEKNNTFAYARFILSKMQALLGIVFAGAPLIILTLVTPIYSLGHTILFGLYALAGRLLGFESPAPQSVKDFNRINRMLWSSVMIQGRAFLYFLFQLSWNGIGLGWSITKDLLKTVGSAGSVSDFIKRSNEKIWAKKETVLREEQKNKESDITLDLLPVVLGLMEIVNHIPHNEMFDILCPKKGSPHHGIYELINDLFDPFNQQSLVNKLLDHTKDFAEILELLKDSPLFISILRSTDKALIHNMLDALIDLTIAIHVQNLEKEMQSQMTTKEKKSLLSNQISQVNALKETIKQGSKTFISELSNRPEQDILYFQSKIFSPLSQLLRELGENQEATYTAKQITSQKSITIQQESHLMNLVAPHLAQMPIFEIAGTFLCSDPIAEIGTSFFNLTPQQKEEWKSLGILIRSFQSSSTDFLQHVLNDFFTDEMILAAQDGLQMSLRGQLSLAEHIIDKIETAMSATNTEGTLTVLKELYEKKSDELAEAKSNRDEASHFLFDLISPLWPDSIALFKEPIKTMLNHFVLQLKDSEWSSTLFEANKNKIFWALHAAIHTMKQPEHLRELSAQRYLQDSKKLESSQRFEQSPLLGSLLAHFSKNITNPVLTEKEQLLDSIDIENTANITDRELLVIVSDFLKYHDRQAFESLSITPGLISRAIGLIDMKLNKSSSETKSVLTGLLSIIQRINSNPYYVQKHFDFYLLDHDSDLKEKYDHFIPAQDSGTKDYQFFNRFYKDNPHIKKDRDAYTAYDFILDRLDCHPHAKNISSYVDQLWKNENSTPQIFFDERLVESGFNRELLSANRDQQSLITSTIDITQSFLSAIGSDSPIIQTALLSITPEILENTLIVAEPIEESADRSGIAFDVSTEPSDMESDRLASEEHSSFELPMQKVIHAYKVLYESLQSVDHKTFAKEQAEILNGILPILDLAQSYIQIERLRSLTDNYEEKDQLEKELILMEHRFHQNILDFIRAFPFHKMKILLDPQMQEAVFAILEEMLPSLLAQQVIKNHLDQKGQSNTADGSETEDVNADIIEAGLKTSAKEMSNGRSPRSVVLNDSFEDSSNALNKKTTKLSQEERESIRQNCQEMSYTILSFLQELSKDLGYRYSEKELNNFKKGLIEIGQYGSVIKHLMAAKEIELRDEQLRFENKKNINRNYHKFISHQLQKVVKTLKNLPLGLFEVLGANKILWAMLEQTIPEFFYKASDREWAQCTIELFKMMSDHLSGHSKKDAQQIRANFFTLLEDMSDQAVLIMECGQDPRLFLTKAGLSLIERLITTLSQLSQTTIGELLDRSEFVTLLLEVLRPYIPQEYKHLMTREYLEQVNRMIQTNPSAFDRAHPLEFLLKFIQSLQSPAAQNLLERYQDSKNDAFALKNRAFLQDILLKKDPIAFDRYKEWITRPEYQQWHERREFLNPLLEKSLQYKAHMIEKTVLSAIDLEQIQNLNIEDWIEYDESVAENEKKLLHPGQPNYDMGLREIQKHENFEQSLLAQHARIMIAFLNKQDKAKENYDNWVNTKEYQAFLQIRSTQQIEKLVKHYEDCCHLGSEHISLERDRKKLLAFYSRDLPEDLPVNPGAILNAITNPQIWPSLAQLFPILDPLLVGQSYEMSLLRAKSNPFLERDSRLINGAHGLMVFISGILSGASPLEMYEALKPDLEKDKDLAIHSARRSHEEDKEAAAFPLLLDTILFRIKEMSDFLWEPISEHTKVINNAHTEDKRPYIDAIIKTIDAIRSIHPLYEAAIIKGLNFETSSLSSSDFKKLEKDLASLSIKELSKRLEYIRQYKSIAQLPHAIGSLTQSLLIPEAEAYKHTPKALLDFIQYLYLLDEEERIEKIRDFDLEFGYFDKDLYGQKELVLSRLYVKWQNAFATSQLSEEQWLLANPIPKAEKTDGLESCSFDPFVAQIDHVLIQEIMNYHSVPKLLEHLSLEIISMMQSIYLMQQADQKRLSTQSAVSIVQFILEQFYSYGNPGQDGTMIRNLLDYAMKNFLPERIWAVANAVGRGDFLDIIIATFSKQTPAVNPPEFDKDMIHNFLAQHPEKTALFIAKNILVPFGKDSLPLGKLNDMERMFASDLLSITGQEEKIESLCEGLFLLLYEIKHFKAQSLSTIIPILERIFDGLRPLINKEPPSEMLSYLLTECPQIQELLYGKLIPYKDNPAISKLLKAIESLGDKSENLEPESKRRKIHDVLHAIDGVIYDLNTIQSPSSSYAEKGVVLGYYGVVLPVQTVSSSLYSWTVGMANTFVEHIDLVTNALANPFDLDFYENETDDHHNREKPPLLFSNDGKEPSTKLEARSLLGSPKPQSIRTSHSAKKA